MILAPTLYDALRFVAVERMKERGCTCQQPDVRVRDFDRMTILQEIHSDQDCKYHIVSRAEFRTTV